MRAFLTVSAFAVIAASSTGAQAKRATLSKLYAAVRQPPMGEYETSIDFKFRTSQVPKTEFEIVLAKTCSENPVWVTRYIADLSGLGVSVVAYPLLGSPIENATSDDVLLPPVVYTECRYTGSGSFVTYGILGPEDDFDADAGGAPYWTQRGLVPSSPQQARLLKPHLILVAVFNVKAAEGRGATLRVAGGSEASEQTQDIRLLRVENVRYEVRDDRTQKVLTVLSKK